MKNSIIYLIALFYLTSCGNSEKKEEKEKTSTESKKENNYNIGNNKNFNAILTELNDEEYPDNPDILIRSKLDGQYSRSNVEFRMKNEEGVFDILFYPQNDKTDTLILTGVNLMEWIPTVPKHIKEDHYLTLIGLINQEWNRQQVKFPNGTFEISGDHGESKITDRIDLARNCLNSGLWELSMYTIENDKQAPYYHAWFDFPQDLYAHLFFLRNGMEFKQFEKHLVDWTDPENKKINFELLRKIKSENSAEFIFNPKDYYPLVGERNKKNKNIMYPKNQTCIQDFLTDSTVFATFSVPGFYNQKDPRKTELGRFQKLDNTVLAEITSTNPSKSELQEIKLTFSDNQNRTTIFRIGGLDFNSMPQLSKDKMHKGFQMPMGIANHTFYQSYEKTLLNPSKESAFYALLTNENDEFLDSHAVGIDGPLMYRDDKDPNILHIWVLSFERHAFIGHYTVDLHFGSAQ